MKNRAVTYTIFLLAWPGETAAVWARLRSSGEPGRPKIPSLAQVGPTPQRPNPRRCSPSPRDSLTRELLGNSNLKSPPSQPARDWRAQELRHRASPWDPEAWGRFPLRVGNAVSTKTGLPQAATGTGQAPLVVLGLCFFFRGAPASRFAALPEMLCGRKAYVRRATAHFRSLVLATLSLCENDTWDTSEDKTTVPDFMELTV
ncbi:uncharacterized protein LOC123330854 [Bubalus bubalis]|uniref:uncharacterized protein LOC123330854 n=1 Tax=Bubalus bubalis TaxID=89462 RepID=UPI001E1B9BAD|nr:uncharacterized protein LOC123330854 [Bubalus bubalis]